MARTTQETASILRDLYDEEFSGDECEQYQIGWDQLRGIAGVERLTDDIIANVGKAMLDSGYALVPFDNFFLVTSESNFKRTRKVPARLVESYLAVTSESLADDDGDQELGDNDEN
jgi:hypothetical protein